MKESLNHKLNKLKNKWWRKTGTACRASLKLLLREIAGVGTAKANTIS